MLTKVKAGGIRCAEMDLGAESPAAGGQWGLGGGSPDAAATLQNTHFLGIVWSKFRIFNG